MCMDMREQVVQEIMAVLKDRVELDVCNIVEDALIIQLNNYEIQERCTEVAIVDSSAEDTHLQNMYIQIGSWCHHQV